MDLENKGWTCPKCGRGLNPDVQQCPCYLGAQPVPVISPFVVPLYTYTYTWPPYTGDPPPLINW